MARLFYMDDRSESYWLSYDTISTVEYGVRSAAYYSLRELGLPVPTLELKRKPTPEEVSRYRRETWRQSFKDALPDGWTTTEIVEGESMTDSDGVKTIVMVSCANGPSHCRWIVIPADWDKAKLPKSGYEGLDKEDGGHYYYFEGTMPDNVKAQLIQCFGLDTSPLH